MYLLSAAHRDSLRDLALRHADFLAETHHRFDDVAFSVFARRSHYTHLLAVVGQTKQAVEDKLRKFADGQVDTATLTTKITRKKKTKLAFVFSGQGGQWVRMGQQLMQHQPVFRRALGARQRGVAFRHVRRQQRRNLLLSCWPKALLRKRPAGANAGGRHCLSSLDRRQ